MTALVMGIIHGTVSSAYAVSVSYIDAAGSTQTADATALTASTTISDGGWYVVYSTLTLSDRITISGTVHLILADGYTLTASKGINVASGDTLNIYGQTKGTGTLTSNGDYDQAGIGGGYSGAGGTITINGGTVNAAGGQYGAGIGGGNAGNGGTVYINGGTVTATGGGDDAVGIGGGDKSTGHGTLTLGSGVVLQTSSNNSSWTTTSYTAETQYSGSYTRYMKAGGGTRYIDASGNVQQTIATALTTSSTNLSGGWYVVSGDLTISTRITISGTVNLILADGCTLSADKGITTTGATLNIYGQTNGTGTLTISGVGDQNAGIGGESGGSGGTVTISGGTVNATGGYLSAGIGGGNGGAGGTVTINGGTVNVTGGQFGAGIGGGYEDPGGNVTINGGTVNAAGGDYGAGIGSGSGGSGNGTLTLGSDIILQTSDNGTTWTTATGTDTRTRYMKTAAASYTITIPSTLDVQNSGWNALDGGIAADLVLASGKYLVVTASSASGFKFVNTASPDQKVAYYFYEGGNTNTNYTSSDAQVSWDFTASGSKDVGIVVEDYSSKPVGTYKEAVIFTVSVEEEPDYTVTVSTNDNNRGSVSGAPESAKAGDVITLTCTPSSDLYYFRAESSTVKDASGNNVTFNYDYTVDSMTFTMPASNVTVNVYFDESN